jgi:hypothetical protein
MIRNSSRLDDLDPEATWRCRPRGGLGSAIGWEGMPIRASSIAVTSLISPTQLELGVVVKPWLDLLRRRGVEVSRR